jgi:acetyltransferase-like isoleucine patch superfamily enzyme
MSSSAKPWMLGNVGRILRAYSAKQLIVRLAEEYLWWLVRSWPGILGLGFRYLFLKATTKKLRGFCWISQGCTLVNTYGLTIGKNFVAARNVLLDGIGGIEIGDHVGIGPNCVLLSQEHSIIGAHRYFDEASYRRRPIRVCSGVWIGANSFVKAGVTLGEDAIIAACSNVVADVPPRGRVIGSPAIPYVRAMRQFLGAQAGLPGAKDPFPRDE